MHVLVAFILGVSLLAGFQPVHAPPEDHAYLVMDGEQNIRIHTQMTSLEDIKQQHLVNQQYDYSCGSAALATILNYHLGENFTERQVIQGMMQHGNIAKIKRRRAFSLLDMKQFVDVLGYQGAGYKAEMEELRELAEPAILPIEIFGFKHFVVLRGFHANRVFVADPWLGNTSYTKQDFAEMWYRQVVFMIEPNGRSVQNLLKLKNEDLRYIREDTARQAFFPPHLPHMQPPSVREHKNIDPDRMIYKR
ncbi:MAG: C39 family peptidase [Desulfobacteraceae bacterium]|nr:C39 family peptidase [Desulfobacteraceae bacterium]